MNIKTNTSGKSKKKKPCLRYVSLITSTQINKIEAEYPVDIQTNIKIDI